MTDPSALHDAIVSYGTLLARAFLAAVFLYSGQGKLPHWQAGIKEVANLGLPRPRFFTAATVATQLLGGLAVLRGIGDLKSLWGVFGSACWARRGFCLWANANEEVGFE
jgi:hypothetical protein